MKNIIVQHENVQVISGKIVSGIEGMERDMKLEIHRQQLEEQVDRRTAQLAQANEQLQIELSERKKIEEQLKHFTEELKQTIEELRDFVYIVSHDLRSPLVSIKGFSGELDYNLKELNSILIEHIQNLDETRKNKLEAILHKDMPESLGFITSSVNRMDSLINSILKLSLFGCKELKNEKINVESLVQSILKSMAHQIEKRDIKVKVGTLPEIVVDRIAIEQIFGNILDNAIKYLDPGRLGVIEITSEHIHNGTLFHIQDNGRGIAKEDIPKVFELFRRVGRQDMSGEGMGLAYVKTLIRRLGGRIWCESELGVGTTFSFFIAD